MKVINLEISKEEKIKILEKFKEYCNDHNNFLTLSNLEIEKVKEWLGNMDESLYLNNFDDLEKIIEGKYLFSYKEPFKKLYRDLNKLWNTTYKYLVFIPNGWKYKLSYSEELLFKSLSSNCNKVIFMKYHQYIEPTIEQCEAIMYELSEFISSDFELSSKVYLTRKEVYKVYKQLLKDLRR